MGNEYAAERRRERQRQYYKKHREERLAYQKQYNSEHKDQIRLYKREYQAEYRRGILRRGENTEDN